MCSNSLATLSRRMCFLKQQPTKALRLARFGKACLPFFTFLACIEHIVEIAGLEDMRREDAVAVPRVAVGGWREDGIVWIGLEVAEVAGADMPDPPDLAIGPAV